MTKLKPFLIIRSSVCALALLLGAFDSAWAEAPHHSKKHRSFKKKSPHVLVQPKPESVVLPGLTVRNDYKPGDVIYFKLVVSGETFNLKGLEMHLPGHEPQLIRIPGPEQVKVTEFRGHDTVRLNLSFLDQRTGGAIDISYLGNVITGRWGQTRIWLERVGDQWMVFSERDEGHREINTLNVKVNLPFGIKGISSAKE